MKILFTHDFDFRSTTGGAELNLRYTYNDAPEGIEVEFLNNRQFLRRKVKHADMVIFGNSRHMTPNSAIKAVDILKELKIPYIKSEHDIMWSDSRIGNELVFSDPFTYEVVADYKKNIWYEPTKYMFENAQKVRYLSPKHKLIFDGSDINPSDIFIAGSYIDRNIFKKKIEFEDRPFEAVVKSAELWGEFEGKKKAEENGHTVQLIAHRGFTIEEMADYFNQFKYFYDFPILHTTYSRVGLEFAMCGGELILKEDHALLSFGSIEKAMESSQNTIKDFWDGVLK